MILKRTGKYLDFCSIEEVEEYYKSHIVKEKVYVKYDIVVDCNGRTLDVLKDYISFNNINSFDDYLEFIKNSNMNIELDAIKKTLMAYINSNVTKKRNREELIITFE